MKRQESRSCGRSPGSRRAAAYVGSSRPSGRCVAAMTMPPPAVCAWIRRARSSVDASSSETVGSSSSQIGRAATQQPGQSKPPLLPGRKQTGRECPPAEKAPNRSSASSTLFARPPRWPRPSAQIIAPEREVLRHGQVRLHARQVPDVVAALRDIPILGVAAFELETCPLDGRMKPAMRADQRRLSGAVGTDEQQRFSGADREATARESRTRCPRSTVRLSAWRNKALDRVRRRGRAPATGIAQVQKQRAVLRSYSTLSPI